MERAVVNITYKYDEFAERTPYIVEKEVLLYGDLSAEEVERLELVSNSPAQQMLTKGMDIRTNISAFESV